MEPATVQRGPGPGPGLQRAHLPIDDRGGSPPIDPAILPPEGGRSRRRALVLGDRGEVAIGPPKELGRDLVGGQLGEPALELWRRLATFQGDCRMLSPDE